MSKTLDFRAFGKNDIRGIYGEDVTEEIFYLAGRGYVKFVVENLNKNANLDEKIEPKTLWFTVTMDARTHSPSLTFPLPIIVSGICANSE